MRSAGLLALFALVMPAAQAADLQTLQGKKVSGELLRVAEGKIIVKTDDQGEVATPIRDTLMVRLAGKPIDLTKATYTEVELLDGTRLHCTAYRLKGKRLEVDLYQPQQAKPLSLQIPINQVLTILRQAGTARSGADWKQLLERRSNRDMVVVARGGRLDALEGTIGAGNEAGNAFTFTLANGRDVPIKLNRIQGLIFSQPPQGNVAATICKITDRYHNLYYVQDLLIKDANISFTTVTGVKVTVPRLDELALLDFSQGKLTFLSDLEPTRLEEVVMTEFAVSYRRDTNLDGTGPLRMQGQEYTKGLAIHPRTVLEYNLGGDYKEFKTVIGVDDTNRTEVGVRVTFDGDGRQLFQLEVKREDPPQPVTLNIKDIQRLRLTVESLTPLDLGNQVNLADAKVSK